MKKYGKTDRSWSALDKYKRGVIVPFKTEIAPNLQIQETTIEPGDTVPPHFHKEQIEFILVVQGTCCFDINSTQIDLVAGDLILIEPREVHSTTNTGEVRLHLLTTKLNGNPSDSVWL